MNKNKPAKRELISSNKNAKQEKDIPGLLVLGYDSRLGCERSRFQIPDWPSFFWFPLPFPHFQSSSIKIYMVRKCIDFSICYCSRFFTSSWHEFCGLLLNPVAKRRRLLRGVDEKHICNTNIIERKETEGTIQLKEGPQWVEIWN